MNQINLNISIDDVSPHPLSSVKVLDRCYEIIDKFPDVKFSLFIPIAYWRTIKKGTITDFPLRIDKFKDFCNTLLSLPDKNFELCYHGLCHGIPGKSDNDEFQYLNYDDALHIFLMMSKIVENANLKDKFKKIFRPPAWRMSPDAIKAADEFGYDILALSPKEYAKKIYCGKDEEFKNVVYYNVNPPYDELKLFNNTEIVYHACEWDKNYLSVKMKDDLINFLNTNKEKINFCFLEGLCEKI